MTEARDIVRTVVRSRGSPCKDRSWGLRGCAALARVSLGTTNWMSTEGLQVEARHSDCKCARFPLRESRGRLPHLELRRFGAL